MLHKSKQIACVTGASGMVGRKIIQSLLSEGYKVRILTRRKHFAGSDVELFFGGLEDKDVLKAFLADAQFLFHCAAELHNKSKMWDVNVSGTERLIHTAGKSKIQYLCHLSSAGVVGRIRDKWVDEKTKCEPQTGYERSKWAAEQIVARGLDGCRVVIIRPTNIVDDTRPGALEVITKPTPKSRLKLLIIGGECSHIIHVDNVAAAALHFIEKSLDTPECFFVSCDHMAMNTFAGLWTLHNQLSKKNQTKNIHKHFYLPIMVPYLFRLLLRGTGNMGDVRYSSEKLISTGFQFPVTIEETVCRFSTAGN